jgi:hypothetical protein
MDLHSIIDKFNELTYEKVIQQVEDLIMGYKWL